MSKEGWIKIYRKLQDNKYWTSNEPFDKRSAWVDIVLSANHSEAEIIFNGQTLVIERGQFLTSVRQLSQQWCWGKDKVLRFLRALENDNMIHRKSTKSATLITVINYGVYQDGRDSYEDTDKDTHKDTDETPTGTPIRTQTRHRQGHLQATNKNEKNVKNENNEKNITPHSPPQAKCYFDDVDLDKTFKNFIDNRKKLKKPMTDNAVDLAIKKLYLLATDSSGIFNASTAIEILNQSILNGWAGLFELKDDRKSNQRKSEMDEWRDA